MSVVPRPAYAGVVPSPRPGPGGAVGGRETVSPPATVVGVPTRGRGPVTRRSIARFVRTDTGAATAEYAVVTVAAAGLGGLLIKLLTSDWFLNILKMILEFIIRAALSFFGVTS